MNITILGSGLIGVCSAYYLQKNGHNVTVLDKNSISGNEASFANGGQISVCYSEPWSSFDNLFKIFSWIGKPDSPILFNPKFDLHQTLWSLQFLLECFPHNNRENIKKMLKLSLYSRKTLQSIREELSLNYLQNTNGILTFYTTEKGFHNGIKAANFMKNFGCNRVVKNKNETISIEPALKNSLLPIYGSDYSFEDESGDAFIFTQQLTEACKSIGVKFIFDSEVTKINTFKNSVVSVSFKNKGSIDIISSDLFVSCLGANSYPILKPIGIYVPIYPAKGYSLTIPILNDDLINKVSLTDLDYKIVLTKLGNNLRVAGTAEFNGYDLSINKERCKALLDRTLQIVPEGLDTKNVLYWTGLRPSTPGNVPIIGKTKYDNLYINSGHGTLGWTMACGSGKLMSQIIDNTKLYD